MRFVTVLIILMLVATVYIANVAPGDDGESAPHLKRVAALAPGSDRGGPAGGGLLLDEDDLSASFPSELTQRSSGAPAPTVSEDSAIGDASRNPFLMDVDEAARRRVAVRAKDSADRPAPVFMGVAPGAGSSDAGSPADAGAVEEPESLRITVPKRTSVPNTRRGPALVGLGLAGAETANPGLLEPKIQGTPKASRRGARELADVALDAPETEPKTVELLETAPPTPMGSAPETEVAAEVDTEAETAAETAVETAVETVGEQALARPNGRIAGRVTDAGGEPTPAVKVEAYDLSTGSLAASATSGRDGRFTMEGLSESKLALRVVADSVPLGIAGPVGQEACRLGDEPLGFGAVCVTPSAHAAASASIVLPYSSGVQGTIVGDGGKVMGGAVVRAVSTVEGFTHVKSLTTTDPEGFFFLNLVPGPYELQIAPPPSAKRERPRRMPIEAQAGSAILMDTIDLMKSLAGQAAELPAAGREPAAAQVTEAAAKLVAPKAPSPGLGSSAGLGAPKAGQTATPVSLPVSSGVSLDQGEVTLTGRVISTWGEVVDGVPVVVTDAAGAVRAEGFTNAEGKYKLSGVPVGECILALAPNEPLRKRGSRGLIVRVRPKPVSVRSFPGQERVVVEDQVVDVAPIFRIDGKIEVSKASFEAFKADLISRHKGMEVLGDERLLRIYMRGLALVQKNTGGKGKSRPIEITPNGSFQWACSLPAEDVIFVLSPRSSVPSPAYDGPVGVEVTPAGVRTAKLTILYPPAPVVKKPSKKGPKQKGSSPKEPAQKPAQKPVVGPAQGKKAPVLQP